MNPAMTRLNKGSENSAAMRMPGSANRASRSMGLLSIDCVDKLAQFVFRYRYNFTHALDFVGQLSLTTSRCRPAATGCRDPFPEYGATRYSRAIEPVRAHMFAA
ncbi:hypothetical protein GCM10009748_15880 [Agromyces lapidis]